jgi:hypothetical protein
MRTTVAKLSLMCVGLIFLSLIFTDLSSAKIDPETVAGVWFFDEGKGAVAQDSSKHGNNGKLVGNPKWVAGKVGQALEFNGKNHVDCGNPASLDINVEALTISAWINPTDISGLDAIVEKECGGSAGYNLYINGGFIHFRMFASANVAAQPAEKVKVNTWTHVCAVYDGKEQRIYYNGVLKDTKKNTGKITKNLKAPLAIGAAPLCPGRGFDGVIDEVAVFNVALNPDQVKEVGADLKSVVAAVAAVSPQEKLAIAWAQIKM